MTFLSEEQPYYRGQDSSDGVNVFHAQALPYSGFSDLLLFGQRGQIPDRSALRSRASPQFITMIPDGSTPA
jgi:hypothetical protein